MEAKDVEELFANDYVAGILSEDGLLRFAAYDELYKTQQKLKIEERAREIFNKLIQRETKTISQSNVVTRHVPFISKTS